jgi:hypothetical protein
MAPPITVDIIAFLLCRKNIARGKPQQGDRYRRGTALALPMPLLSRYALQRDTPGQSKLWWSARSNSRNIPRSISFPYCGSFDSANSTQCLCPIVFTC